jgi:hypothetical protein
MKTPFRFSALGWWLIFAAMMTCAVTSSAGAPENTAAASSLSAPSSPALVGQVQYQEDQPAQGRLIWQFNAPPSAHVVYTWYTVVDGAIQQYRKGGFAPGAEAGLSRLFIQRSEKDDKLVFDFSCLIGAHPNALTVSCETEIPANAQFNEATFGGNAQFTSSDVFPLWRGDWVADGKIVKSFVLVARLEPLAAAGEPPESKSNETPLRADAAPLASAAKHAATSPWSAPVQGVQTRLHTEQPSAKTDDTLAFSADLRNQGTLGNLTYDGVQGPWGMEIDGMKLASSNMLGFGPHVLVKLMPGNNLGHIPFVFDPRLYVGSGSAPYFTLSPGKHTVTYPVAAFYFPSAGGKAQKITIPTPPLEIEILPAAPVGTPPAKP